MIPAMTHAATPTILPNIIQSIITDSGLPVADTLPALRAALTSGNAVLTAPPGSGKTTLLPLALLNEPWLAGQKILMLEPRRLATRGAATRMAELLGEAVGNTVGYSMRMERKISPHSRIEVVTEGLLTRRLQNDPELKGVGLVIFDELHERNLHADLALSLCLDAQAGYRDDLRILAMSATLDADATKQALAQNDQPAPVICAEGRSYPVDVNYVGGEPARKPRDIAANVAAALKLALQQQAGSVLVFLPGRREIDECARTIRGSIGAAELLTLHGGLSANEQRRALQPITGDDRRVILSSAIAETSLTLPGIGAVIDSGLSRVAVYDPNTGFTRLETKLVSKASAIQRSGRAGRLGPGLSWRLWSEAIHTRLVNQQPAEIDSADLAPLRLELASWGITNPADLRWLSPPPSANWQQAGDLLRQLGAINTDGTATRRGQAMAKLGAHPRLAAMLSAAPKASRQTACDLAALLSDRDPLRRGADIDDRLAAVQRFRQGKDKSYALRQIDQLSRRWQQQLQSLPATSVGDWSAGALLLLAFPERLAQPQGPERLKLANGRGAQLPPNDSFTHWLKEPGRFLVVAELNQRQGDGMIRLAAGISRDELNRHFAHSLQNHNSCRWDDKQQRIISEQQTRYGELVLDRRATTTPDKEAIAAVWLRLIRDKGLRLLDWPKETEQLRWRIQLLHNELGEPWPDCSDATLLQLLEQWLAPFLDGVTTLNALQKVDIAEALRASLPWPLTQKLNSLAPTSMELPNGQNRRLDYSEVAGGKPPVLAAKLQHLFGMKATPTIANGRVALMVHLLSPAQRPLQVTQDLENFWATTYADVRKEMRGRYPKHDWPEKPY